MQTLTSVPAPSSLVAPPVQVGRKMVRIVKNKVARKMVRIVKNNVARKMVRIVKNNVGTKMVRIVQNNVGRKMVRIVKNNVGRKMVRIVKNNVSFAFSFLLFFIFAFLRVQSVFSSPPQLPMTSYLKRFPSQILFISYFVLSYFMLKSQYFPFMLSAKQGKCWYNLITSSV